MSSIKKRKEVVLDPEILAILEEKAKKQGRNLKNYMEFVLMEKANDVLEEPKAIEIIKALKISKSQSKKGLVKTHKDVMASIKKKVNESSVDKAS